VAYSPTFRELQFSEVCSLRASGRAELAPGPDDIALLAYEEDGSIIGCLGVPYKRGSTKAFGTGLPQAHKVVFVCEERRG
jgi:hypothetical protein